VENNMADYKSVTPGASPSNPIVTANQYAPNPSQPNNPTGEPLPGTSSGARAKLMRDEYNEKERINKKEEKELKTEKDKQDREYEKKSKQLLKKHRKNAGIEIPKQGLHRFGYAEQGMTSEKGLFGIQMEPEGGSGYSDAFSGGGQDLFSGGSGRRGKSAGAQMSVNFGKMSGGLSGLSLGGGGMFSGLGSALTSDGKAKGFGGYRDPFAGSAPKAKTGAKKSKKAKRTPSLGGGSIFNLRLF
jgi:hypothetical protein